MGYYEEKEASEEPSVFHVTLPIVHSVTILVRAPADTDTDDLAALAYQSYKHGADTIGDVSAECVENNAPSEREWEPDDFEPSSAA
jgi:hypothetical protein